MNNRPISNSGNDPFRNVSSDVDFVPLDSLRVDPLPTDKDKLPFASALKRITEQTSAPASREENRPPKPPATPPASSTPSSTSNTSRADDKPDAENNSVTPPKSQDARDSREIISPKEEDQTTDAVMKTDTPAKEAVSVTPTAPIVEEDVQATDEETSLIDDAVIIPFPTSSANSPPKSLIDVISTSTREESPDSDTDGFDGSLILVQLPGLDDQDENSPPPASLSGVLSIWDTSDVPPSSEGHVDVVNVDSTLEVGDENATQVINVDEITAADQPSPAGLESAQLSVDVLQSIVIHTEATDVAYADLNPETSTKLATADESTPETPRLKIAEIQPTQRHVEALSGGDENAPQEPIPRADAEIPVVKQANEIEPVIVKTHRPEVPLRESSQPENIPRNVVQTTATDQPIKIHFDASISSNNQSPPDKPIEESAPVDPGFQQPNQNSQYGPDATEPSLAATQPRRGTPNPFSESTITQPAIDRESRVEPEPSPLLQRLTAFPTQSFDRQSPPQGNPFGQPPSPSVPTVAVDGANVLSNESPEVAFPATPVTNEQALPVDASAQASDELAPQAPPSRHADAPTTARHAQRWHGELHLAHQLDRLAHYIQQSEQQDRTLSIRLHPPELGALQIDVTQRDGMLTARLEVQTQAAHRLLGDSLPKLHEALAQLGAAAERIELQIVTAESGRDQFRFDQSDQRSQHRNSDQQDQNSPDASLQGDSRRDDGQEQRRDDQSGRRYRVDDPNADEQSTDRSSSGPHVPPGRQPRPRYLPLDSIDIHI